MSHRFIRYILPPIGIIVVAFFLWAANDIVTRAVVKNRMLGQFDLPLGDTKLPLSWESALGLGLASLRRIGIDTDQYVFVTDLSKTSTNYSKEAVIYWFSGLEPEHPDRSKIMFHFTGIRAHDDIVEFSIVDNHRVSVTVMAGK